MYSFLKLWYSWKITRTTRNLFQLQRTYCLFILRDYIIGGLGFYFLFYFIQSYRSYRMTLHGIYADPQLPPKTVCLQIRRKLEIMNSCINYMSKLFSYLFQKARITACCFELLRHFFFLLKCLTKHFKNPQIELMFCVNVPHKAMYQNMQRSFLSLLLHFLFWGFISYSQFFHLILSPSFTAGLSVKTSIFPYPRQLSGNKPYT